VIISINVAGNASAALVQSPAARTATLFVSPEWPEDKRVPSGSFRELDSFFRLTVDDLRCRGPAFNAEEHAAEAVRNYDLVINGETIFNFNTRCVYGGKREIGGDFTSQVVVVPEVLSFDPFTDPLSIQVILQPDGIVALEGAVPAP